MARKRTIDIDAASIVEPMEEALRKLNEAQPPRRRRSPKMSQAGQAAEPLEETEQLSGSPASPASTPAPTETAAAQTLAEKKEIP